MNLESKSIDSQYMAYLTEHNLTSAQYPMTTYVIEHHLQQVKYERPEAKVLREMHQFNDRYMRGKR